MVIVNRIQLAQAIGHGQIRRIALWVTSRRTCRDQAYLSSSGNQPVDPSPVPRPLRADFDHWTGAHLENRLGDHVRSSSGACHFPKGGGRKNYTGVPGPMATSRFQPSILAPTKGPPYQIPGDWISLGIAATCRRQSPVARTHRRFDPSDQMNAASLNPDIRGDNFDFGTSRISNQTLQ